MVTGVDLVEAQLNVAANHFLPDLPPASGHAIQCRINAEDPERRFAPTPGRIEELFLPGGPGVRIDSHIEAGYIIPKHYDSMLAKLVVYGDDREEAIRRSLRGFGGTMQP